MRRRRPPRHSAAWVVLALVVLLASAVMPRAQDATDEHRCTGQSRATNEERIASCTALINSGLKFPLAATRPDEVLLEIRELAGNLASAQISA